MVIDFNGKFRERQQQEQQEAAKAFFMQHIKPYLTANDKQALLDAIAKGDIEAYKAITEPIIMRNLIRKFN